MQTESISFLQKKQDKNADPLLFPLMTSMSTEGLALVKSNTLSLASAAAVQTGWAPAVPLSQCNYQELPGL